MCVGGVWSCSKASVILKLSRYLSEEVVLVVNCNPKGDRSENKLKNSEIIITKVLKYYIRKYVTQKKAHMEERRNNSNKK